ncbi:PhoX family protein [Croceicoccus bisphenolivorans]|uniref:PhoX family protein n=1 Tax=Croceicoccus bisphenolivorans TaxID=1783232 RepID=UPI000836634E|nr:alkaline phosphatase PhoX [Croceicoccus bisphenolivorans]
MQIDSMNRRALLRGSATAGAFTALGGVLGGLMSRQAMAAHGDGQLVPAASPYGAVFPTKDQETGLELLKLPRGFTYRSMSWSGDLMTDGSTVRGVHDGMGVVSVGGKGGQDTFLIRNHELRPLGTLLPAPGKYDTNLQNGAYVAGGCDVLRVRNGKLIEHYPTLGGTSTNCAGGVTPWGTWLTCEETTYDGRSAGGLKHGYVFECSIDPTETTGQPIVGMGRFAHEAVAVDPVTGYVYQTEDNRNRSGLYRYKPNNKPAGYGALAQGGQLQAAKIVGVDGAMITALGGANAVNSVGDVLQVEWVDLDNPDADPSGGASGPYLEAVSKGALTMSRGEGIWHHGDSFAIVDTAFGRDSSGRDGRGLGSVWIYTPDTSNPARGTLTLLYAAAARVAGNNPDNITYSPRGGIVTCDDGDDVDDGFGAGQRLMGYTDHGEAYILAKSNVILSDGDIAGMNRTGQFSADDYRGSEFCGACFDPSGETLFVNVQSPGITFAIRGPWAAGNL